MNMGDRKTKTPQQALASLMRLASRAEKSSDDALRLMRGWGVSDGDARAVLQRLTDDKFIDDQRFTRVYVREKMRLAGWGEHKIRAALRAKKIAPETIERELKSIESRDKTDGRERLESAMERKFRSLRSSSDVSKKSSSDTYEIRGKLIRFGLARGHNFDQIEQIVDKILKQKYED